MRELVRVYRGFIKAQVLIAFTYRASVVLYIIGFVFPFVMLAIWLTVEQQTGPIGDFDRSAFISYYIAAAAVFRFTNASPVYHWDGAIRMGDLSMWLLKPLDPFHHFFGDILGWKLFDVVIVVPLVVAATLIIPDVSYPLTPARAVAFIASMVVALLLVNLIGSAMGMLSFWTTQSRNFAMFWHGIGQFLSGFIVPIALLPPAVQTIAQWLPFRSMVSLPVEILTGSIQWHEIGRGFAVGIGWALVAALVYRTLWRLGLRRYEAVGA